MHIAPLPSDEPERLARLHDLGVLDTLPQRTFDDITALASSLCEAPIALISLVDAERQWFKSRVGLDIAQTGRDESFCAHTILQPQAVMEVADASADPRFVDNPLVIGPPDIRFYAGAPIVTADGLALGTVCVIDRKQRYLSESQRRALQSLSSLVVHLLEHEREQQELQRRRQQEAAQREEVLTAMSLAGLDLMSYVDAQCRYRYVNDMYLTYWKRERSRIVGHHVSELAGHRLWDRTIKPQLERALAGERVHFEATIRFPGVGRRHVEITYMPMRDDNGQVAGLVVRSHDIHELKKREVQLRRAVELLEQKTLEQQRFIHIISHDIREPLNSINNFSSLLLEDHSGELSAPALTYLNYVNAGGQRMKLLLDDLLHFVQLERHAVTLQPVDVNQLMRQVCDDLAHALERLQGRLTWDPLPTVMADPTLLRIALQNMVSNGLKFSRALCPPVVHLSATQSKRKHLLCIQDNGIGLPANQIENIFELFRRLHSRAEYAGSGLGLSICRRIAELHRGEIRVQSREGVGSRFTLVLPS